jgi:predicted nuclease of predicted toxin-antitoxin system
VRCGNTSNRAMKGLLAATFDQVRRLLATGEPLVELKS